MKLSDRLRAQYAASAHGWHYPDMLEAANELDRLAALAVPPVPTATTTSINSTGRDYTGDEVRERLRAPVPTAGWQEGYEAGYEAGREAVNNLIDVDKDRD